MKIFSALLFVAVGVWLAFQFPEEAASAFAYIDYAFQWVVAQVTSLMGG
ncbi:hypothetical protein [Idiomarina sp.]|nr:hypothetical protein [Idiomarina sp.]